MQTTVTLERSFIEILGRALVCGTLTAVLLMVAGQVGPDGLGGRVSPLGEFWLWCVSFWIGMTLAFTIQISVVRTFRMWPRALAGRRWASPRLLAVAAAWSAGILLLLGTSLVAGWGFFAFLLGSSTANMDRSTRMADAPALTDEEGRTLATSHFDLTVTVREDRDYLPLIPMFRDTGLFDDVEAFGQVADPDLIITRTDDPRGQHGHSLTIAAADAPADAISISVGYYPVPWWAYDPGDRAQYRDRLAVEVIKAVNQLLARQAATP